METTEATVGDSAAADRIRRAAIEAFAESGYAGSSTRQITKRLNMSATAMYPHFRSKEDLLYAIALDGHRTMLSVLRDADDETANHSRRLTAVVSAFATWQAEFHQLARVVQYELHALTPEHYRTITAIRRDTTAVIHAIVMGGATSREFDVDDIDDVVLAISSLCVDVCRWFPSGVHREPRRVGDAYARIVGRMVRPTS